MKPIPQLYEKYKQDLTRVRRLQQKIYPKIEYLPKVRVLTRKYLNTPKVQLSDTEAEITYMMVRETKPNLVVEASPLNGWSTTWLLRALEDNNKGQLYSYDLNNHQPLVDKLPNHLKKRWHMHPGDMRDRNIPKKIDYLFLDSEHTGSFARFYIKKIFPNVKKDSVISIHDINGPAPTKEKDEVIRWLKRNKKQYHKINEEIREARIKTGFHNIHHEELEYMIWFIK